MPTGAEHALPGVSCVCLTYGRPHLLEEAIYAFLQQDYRGPKELLVLNDFDAQTLELDHPEVRIVNVPHRFRTLGEKRNAAVALCAHDLLFVWDDDDICLPHWLSLGVRRLDPSKGFLKPARAWYLSDGNLTGPWAEMNNTGSCWTRELFDLVRGYAPIDESEDAELEVQFEAARPGSRAPTEVRPEEVPYIYRWGGTGSYHFCAFYNRAAGDREAPLAVADFVAEEVRRGAVPRGTVPLSPHWRTDYAALVGEALAAQAART